MLKIAQTIGINIDGLNRKTAKSIAKTKKTDVMRK
jgi:hypothetical protein